MAETIHPIVQNWANSTPNKVAKTPNLFDDDEENKKKDEISTKNKKGKSTAWGRKANQSWEDKMVELSMQSIKRNQK